MRSTIALFSVSIVTLLFTNDPVKAQCASGWGLRLPDGKHSPCFEVNLDTNLSSIGAMPSHDELITRVTPAAEDYLWKGSTTSLRGEINREGVVSIEGLLGSSVAVGGVITDEGLITNDSIVFPFKAPKDPLVRDLFLRSSENLRTVWPASPSR